MGAIVSTFPTGGFFPRLPWGDSFVQTGGGGLTSVGTSILMPGPGHLTGLSLLALTVTSGVTVNVHRDRAAGAVESVTDTLVAGVALFLPLSATFVRQLLNFELQCSGSNLWWTLQWELD